MINDTPISSLSQRHSFILSMLAKQGNISVSELGKLTSVSEVTIRKDLSILEQQKKLYRSHGSAIVMSPYVSNKHLNEKECQNVDQKVAIGKKAAELLIANDSIIIASGTTMMYFASHLGSQLRGHISVVTSSLPVSTSLSQNSNVDVFQLGGVIRQSSVSVVGQSAQTMLKEFHCSKLFLGVDGIDVNFGVTTTNVMEANLNRQMIESAQKVVVLADSTKFGRIGFSKICDVVEVDEIITDSNIAPAMLNLLTSKGIVVTVVSVI